MAVFDELKKQCASLGWSIEEGEKRGNYIITDSGGKKLHKEFGAYAIGFLHGFLACRNTDGEYDWWFKVK